MGNGGLWGVIVYEVSNAIRIIYEAHTIARCLENISIYQIDIEVASVFILQDS